GIGSDASGDHAFRGGRADRATVMSGASGDASTTPVDVLAIDPATFSGAATWPGSRAQHDALLADLEPTASSVPAIVAGGRLPTTRLDVGRAKLTVEPIAALDSFPGLHSGAVLVVID